MPALTGKKKKISKKIKVSNYIASRLLAIPPKYQPPMRGRRHNVETITPFSLFPDVTNASSVYRVTLT